jgi:hypothetical protein
MANHTELPIYKLTYELMLLAILLADGVKQLFCPPCVRMQRSAFCIEDLCRQLVAWIDRVHKRIGAKSFRILSVVQVDRTHARYCQAKKTIEETDWLHVELSSVGMQQYYHFRCGTHAEVA